MQSPLDIRQTIERYQLEEQRAELSEFDAFIWQDIEIVSVEQLLDFERRYQEYARLFCCCFDSEYAEMTVVDMKDGSMSCLEKGRFQLFSNVFEENIVSQAFISAGLTELETLSIMTFLADISVMYRADSYHYGIPPFVQSLIAILTGALDKLPPYNEMVVRACKEEDPCGFTVGEVFTPGFFITTSADLNWPDISAIRYCIVPLHSNETRARALFLISDNSEKQVTFLEDARFIVEEVRDLGEGRKEIVMSEF